MHHIWRSTRSELGSKSFEQNLPENYSKSTKIAITAWKFSKISGGASPGPFLNQLQISSADKNAQEKYVEIKPPRALLKFLATPLPTLVVR